jgi:hypothetical protein
MRLAAVTSKVQVKSNRDRQGRAGPPRTANARTAN